MGEEWSGWIDVALSYHHWIPQMVTHWDVNFKNEFNSLCELILGVMKQVGYREQPFRVRVFTPILLCLGYTSLRW